MITYDAGTWALGHIFSCRGSVLPKSAAVAFPAAILAAVLNYFTRPQLGDTDMSSVSYLSSTYSIVLGFLLVFRAQTAYGRFWEGGEYLSKIKSGWFNAASNVFSFCTPKPEKRQEVMKFKHQLVRLMSMMYSAALQSAAGENFGFDVLDFEGLDNARISWAETQRNKPEIIMNWLQTLLVEKHRAGIIQIEPPILSRVFQEFSNGMIEVSNAKRIFEYPFPFPYSQMISVMQLAHFVGVIIIGGVAMTSPYTAFLYAFFSTISIWSINFVAIEIEMPFGTDPNDLPLVSLQESMNEALVLLLHPMAEKCPDMAPISAQHLTVGGRRWGLTDPKQPRASVVAEIGETKYCLGAPRLDRCPALDQVPQVHVAELNQPKVVLPPSAGASKNDIGALHVVFDPIADQIEKHHEAFTRELRLSSRDAEDAQCDFSVAPRVRQPSRNCETGDHSVAEWSRLPGQIDPELEAFEHMARPAMNSRHENANNSSHAHHCRRDL